MKPILMVDDFVMTSPTFPPHMHAGISAVTVMFEDSLGGFRNRDTLGSDLVLKPGDLYWLTAGSGAVHEELPEGSARTHALQIFVDLPGHLKSEPARAFHVKAEDVTIIEAEGHRVRVVLDDRAPEAAARGVPVDITVLDGFLYSNGSFSHELPDGHQAWLYAVSGALTVRLDGELRFLPEGTALTISGGEEAHVALGTEAGAHFFLMAVRHARHSLRPERLATSAAYPIDQRRR
nr:pirin family protein [Rhizobium sp. P38BS-XIX]